MSEFHKGDDFSQLERPGFKPDARLLKAIEDGDDEAIEAISKELEQSEPRDLRPSPWRRLLRAFHLA